MAATSALKGRNAVAIQVSIIVWQGLLAALPNSSETSSLNFQCEEGLNLQLCRTLTLDLPRPVPPRLLILNPFVRQHRIDENASGEVAPLLAYLRELQRRYGVAVLVVLRHRPAIAQQALPLIPPEEYWGRLRGWPWCSSMGSELQGKRNSIATKEAL
jgi:hypothetical protein